jgi:hypothetical protein
VWDTGGRAGGGETAGRTGTWVGGWYYDEYWRVGMGWDGVDWIDLAQDRDQWRALVNTVMNLRVP